VAYQVQELAGLIRSASSVLVFTGAGMSTRSGIPDYRGPQGVWKRRQPVYLQDFLASAESRIEYWDYKLEGWAQFRDARPNPAHEALAELERLGHLDTLVTQNIDGLHVAAGNSEARVVEIHGTNRFITCMTCGRRYENEPVFTAWTADRVVPLCEEEGCSGWLKPATISFGQSLDPDILERSFEAARQADLAISIGSSLVVEPAASVPLAAKQKGASYCILNQGETAHDPICDLRIDADAADFLPRLIEALDDR